MNFRPLPYARPAQLIRLTNGKIALRVTAPNGERMATHLRPMTLDDVAGAMRVR